MVFFGFGNVFSLVKVFVSVIFVVICCVGGSVVLNVE